jgi:hypothetical protein
MRDAQTFTFTSASCRRGAAFPVLRRKVLERGAFVSVHDLVRTIYRFVDHWNRNAEPFDWNATADEVTAEVEQLHRDFKGSARRQFRGCVWVDWYNTHRLHSARGRSSCRV